MNVVEYYQKMIESGEIISDPNQWVVASKLQALYEKLLSNHKRIGLITHLKNRLFKKTNNEMTGLYIWGTVGAGKTFLMNAFFYNLPSSQKQRWHYVDFMAKIHQDLKQLQGKQNPLSLIAKQLANENRVICLDEFIVTEITDAMLLGRLLHDLVKNGCMLVLTSNVVPSELYKNGLQREQFMPVIELIQKKFDVVELSLERDYRRRYQDYKYFLLPEDKAAHDAMETYFREYAANQIVSYEPLNIADHQLFVKKRAGKIIWFDFTKLCYPPRSQFDYLEIVKHFDTILLSQIKPILSHQHDVARLFIKLIDVIYDHRKRLIISSNVPIEAIYVSGILSQEFQRTKSRLIELAGKEA